MMPTEIRWMSKASIAQNRFGLGARPDHDPPTDPAAWLKTQMRTYRPQPEPIRAVMDRDGIVDAYVALQTAQRNARMAPSMESAEAMQPLSPEAGANAVRAANVAIRQQYEAQVAARISVAVASDAPFIERLVHFWANHFAVSVDKQTVLGWAGMLEFEAVRPHVLGRFQDMLIAVEQHPAMLRFLDQTQSTGPDSRRAKRAAASGQQRGLNENLAREIMELHTLGVRTGYSQADVTEFARALTGWTLVAADSQAASVAPGAFRFLEAQHEPGERTIMGKVYTAGGIEQGKAILIDLARHPDTAHHIATKLARHFAGDNPPASLVTRLETVWHDSDGDLSQVYAALIDAPEGWTEDPVKFRTPWEWLIAIFRAQGEAAVGKGDAAQVARRLSVMFDQLGQPIWRPGSPAGYDDISASWAGADALMRRVEMAQRLASRASSENDPRLLAKHLFGPTLSANTLQSILRAAEPRQSMALLMVAPEMMRR